LPPEQMRAQRPEPGAMTAVEDLRLRDMRDDIVEEDGDRSRPVGAAVRRDIEPEVEPLRWPAPPREEHLDVRGHAGDELRSATWVDERHAPRVSKQYPGLREP